MKSFLAVRGLPVVTVAEGGYAGKLDDFLFRFDDVAILGFRLRAPGFWGGALGVACENVVRLGRDYVLVSGDDVVERERGGGVVSADRAWWSDWVGVKVLARRGTDLGRVEDVLVDERPSRLRALVLDGGRVVLPGRKALVGRDAVIVDEEAAVHVFPEKHESAEWWEKVTQVVGG